MLHWGPLDPLNYYYQQTTIFYLLIPRDYPLTSLYPCTTQSPLISDLRRQLPLLR